MSNRVGPQIGNGTTELRGPANVSYAYAYNNESHQKRPQTHRSSTISSNGETPIKYKTTRKPNMASNVERTHILETSPLFLDRLLDGEVQDFREFTRIIEKQNREIVELKNTNIEMEGRLEHQTRERIELECIIEDQEKLWNERCQQLTKERDEFFKSLQTEKTTNKKLWDLVYAKEKEIQRAYQRRVSTNIQSNFERTVDSFFNFECFINLGIGHYFSTTDHHNMEIGEGGSNAHRRRKVLRKAVQVVMIVVKQSLKVLMIF